MTENTANQTTPEEQAEMKRNLVVLDLTEKLVEASRESWEMLENEMDQEDLLASATASTVQLSSALPWVGALMVEAQRAHATIPFNSFIPKSVALLIQDSMDYYAREMGYTTHGSTDAAAPGDHSSGSSERVIDHGIIGLDITDDGFSVQHLYSAADDDPGAFDDLNAQPPISGGEWIHGITADGCRFKHSSDGSQLVFTGDDEDTYERAKKHADTWSRTGQLPRDVAQQDPSGPATTHP